MTSRVPLAPLPKIPSSRKSRVCTREACEACREKKTKCSGEKPCSRCRYRNERCEYLNRSHQTKHSLRAELEQMKGAQHRSNTILGALAELGQAHEVFRLLRGGETFETIHESFDSHKLASPAPGQTPEAWSQSRSVEVEKASWNPAQASLCFSSIPDCSYSHGSEASHIRGAINQHAIPTNTKEELAGPSTHFNASMLNNMAFPDSMSECSAMENNTAIMPHGEFIDCNTWMFGLDAQYTADDNVAVNFYPWQPEIPTPRLPTNEGVPSFTDHSGWLCPHFILPHLLSQGQASFLQPSAPSSLRKDSFLTYPPLSVDKPCSNHESNIASTSGSQFPLPPPPAKRRKYDDTWDYYASATPGAGASTKTKTTYDEDIIQTKSQNEETLPHGRENQRRASARSWQKQKQKNAELEATMHVSENCNQRLQREYEEIASKVMDAENSLLEHAQCKHPAINAWLRCHAADYVLKKGAAADRERTE